MNIPLISMIFHVPVVVETIFQWFPRPFFRATPAGIFRGRAALNLCRPFPSWPGRERWSSGMFEENIWGFPKIGGTSVAGWFLRKLLLKWMILGYPYFRKPPFLKEIQ